MTNSRNRTRTSHNRRQKETDKGKHRESSKVWLRTRRRIRRKLLSR